MTAPTQGEDTGSGTAPQGQPAHGKPGRRGVKRTRIGGVWIAAALFALVLLLLLIFILENGHKVDIAYFGAHVQSPLGVALLLAAILGVLLVLIPTAARIMQLRMATRRQSRAAAKDAPRTPATTAEKPSPDAPGQP
jgi:uncharacterized integral membrane protein